MFCRFIGTPARLLRQAKSAEGNVLCAVRKVNGVHHTLTVWTNRKALQAFLYRGAHRNAIAAFSSIAAGGTISLEMDHIPDWEEALALWHAGKRDYVDKDQNEPVVNPVLP